jgi:hypothetical protein
VCRPVHNFYREISTAPSSALLHKTPQTPLESDGTMHELIAHPLLQFYILRLSGTLRYTLTIAGRAPKHFELSDADFEGFDPNVKEEGFQNVPGKIASAVGVELKLVRNGGLLEVKFEGRNGGVAEWKYVGLQEQGKFLGMATQTESAKMVEGGVQTDEVAKVNAGAQTEVVRMRDVHVQTNYTSETSDKLINTCAALRNQLQEQSNSITAEIQKDEWTDPWPRYLFLKGFKSTDSGSNFVRSTLHIDRKVRKMQYREKRFWRYGYQPVHLHSSQCECCGQT